MQPDVLGLDIGGANLKAAHSSGAARLMPFELWKQPAGLADGLTKLIQTMPRFDVLAVTMTGELCDCFDSRRQGVLAILDAVSAVAKCIPTRVWLTTGHFARLDKAKKVPLRASAANWLALSFLAGMLCHAKSALLIDVGSTTTDIVPLYDGKPVPRARTDRQRLRSRELVYTGTGRTPLCALLGGSAAAELFATTADAYLVLGNVPENPLEQRTADGRPATVPYAYARLARMLCADAQTCPRPVLHRLAEKARAGQMSILKRAIQQVASSLSKPPEAIIVSGSGEFLAHLVLDRMEGIGGRRISLGAMLGPEISKAACAYAVAMLAAEQ